MIKKLWGRITSVEWEYHRRLPLPYVLEAALGLAVLYQINRVFFPDNPTFLNTSPHPYWILVFLIAIRYPLKETLAALALIAEIYIVALFTNDEKTFYFSTLSIFVDFKVPLLFILVGGVVSESTTRLTNYLNIAKSDIETLKEKNERLETEIVAARQSLNILETRIATQYTGFTYLFDHVYKAKRLTMEEVKKNILEVLVKILKVDHCTFYEVVQEQIRPVYEYSDQAEEYEKLVPETDYVLLKALRGKVVTHVAKGIGEKQYDENTRSSIIAGPIVTADRQLIGMVAVNHMKFIGFTENFIQLFTTILRWWGAVIDDKRQTELLKSKNIFDEELGVYRYTYFDRRLKQEFYRSKQYAIPLVVGTLEVTRFGDIAGDQQPKIMAIVAQIFTEGLDPLEMVFDGKVHGSLHIIFPIITKEEADAKTQRLIDKINGLNLTPYQDTESILQVSWRSTAFDMAMNSEANLLGAESLVEPA